MASVFDVAKYILHKKGEMTTFKLQKLVYYSQVWSLVWDEKILFNEKIFAWADGPVCRDLYNIHKGSFNVSEQNVTGNINHLQKDQKETIDAIIKCYGKFSGQQLSNLTHRERPWVEARAGLKVGERGNKEIDLQVAREYYSALYAEQQNKAK